jgi:hypothetical protein
MAEGVEEEEGEESKAAMVCAEGGRNAMSRRQGLWRNQHGKVVVSVVQSRRTRVACVRYR